MKREDSLVLNYIKRFGSKEHPVMGKEIAMVCGLPGFRNVQSCIHRLKCEHGHIEILANHFGYYYSEDPVDQYNYFLYSLASRLIGLSEVYNVYKRKLKSGVFQLDFVESMFEEVDKLKALKEKKKKGRRNVVKCRSGN